MFHFVAAVADLSAIRHTKRPLTNGVYSYFRMQ